MSHTRNFEPNEKVMHKLLGAAYQMTFDENYDLAAHVAAVAVSHWEQTNDSEPPTGVRASEQLATSAAKDTQNTAEADGGVEVESDSQTSAAPRLPGDGTKMKQGLFALATVQDGPHDYVTLPEVRESAGVDKTRTNAIHNAVNNGYGHVVDKRSTDTGHPDKWRVVEPFYSELTPAKE